MSLLHISKKNSIVIIELNRPEKHNAMNFELLRALIKIAEKLKKDRQIRCVILTGKNHVFSSGIDLADLKSKEKQLIAVWELLKPGQSLFQKAFLCWQDFPVPVICALEGYCFGAGMQLALAADLRIAHSNTQFSIMESRWGLVPDMGLTHSLKGLVAPDIAKELSFTGRIFDAQEAKQLGLITYLDDQPLDKAMQIAEQISQRSPDSIQAIKEVLNAMWHQPNQALRLEKIWQLKLLFGKNSQRARLKNQDANVQFLPREF